MDVQPDFRDLLELFNARAVSYIIVGGYALAFHGAPRTTGDIDLFVEPAHDNAQRVLDALHQFGFESAGLKTSDFETPDQVVQLGVPPVRVDIITSLTGVSWDEAYTGRVQGAYGDIPVSYLGREELVSNKRAIGRRKDLADLEALGEE
jgi:hypothetical protein